MMKYDYDRIFKLPFTERVYNKQPYLKTLTATVLFAQQNMAVFDKTIFYAESGGQVSDSGEIVTKDEQKLAVVDVQHKLGHKLAIQREDVNVPYVDVETRIMHIFSSDINLNIGDEVTMQITWPRRYIIMQHHTLAHFLFYAFHRYFDENNDPVSVKGCFIDENKATFSLNKKISPDAWEKIKSYTLTKIALAKPIIIEPEPQTETIFYWRYDDLLIPCGGTHIANMNELDLNRLFFHKKSSGKGSSRVYISTQPIV